MTHPKDMSYGEYDDFIQDLPTVQLKIMYALRESRYIMAWFPPYSSGAGDSIDMLIKALKDEWGVEYNEDNDSWDDAPRS